MADAVARDGDVSLRLLRDGCEDYAVMARWLSDERVLEWYHGRDDPHDAATVAARYGPAARGEEAMRPHLVERGGRPVGYIQCYPLGDSPESRALVEDPRGAWGID